jgi:hypothetical protein
MPDAALNRFIGLMDYSVAAVSVVMRRTHTGINDYILNVATATTVQNHARGRARRFLLQVVH